MTPVAVAPKTLRKDKENAPRSSDEEKKEQRRRKRRTHNRDPLADLNSLAIGGW